MPEEMFPTVEDGHVQMRLKRFNINPFGIGGRYAGMITRISDRAVINVSAGGGLLPSVVGRHKQRLLAEDDRQEATSHDVPGLSAVAAAATTWTRTRSASQLLPCPARAGAPVDCGWLAAGAELRAQVRARRPPPRRRALDLARCAAACTSCATRATTRARPARSWRRCSTRLDRRARRRVRRARLREAKPLLMRAIRIHLESARPGHGRAVAAAAAPDGRAPGAAHRARAGDAPATAPGAIDDLGALPIAAARGAATLHVMPPLEEPARDEFVEVTEEGDPYLVERAVRQRPREPRAGRAGGAAPLLPRPDGRRAVRGRADGPQLARVPGDAVGLPRRHGAPDMGRAAPRDACTTS